VFARQEGIQFKIIYEFIPSKTLAKNYFSEYVKRIYNLCDESKLSVNGAIGCLNKKTSKNQKDYFTSSINDAIRFYFKNENSVYFKEKDLYHIRVQTETPVFEITWCIYSQILENNNILLYKMAKQLGGTLVRLKTDSVIVEDGNDVEFSDNKAPGTYKKETIPDKFYPSDSFINKNDYQLDTVPWNHTTSGSRFLTGGPGCGKSYKINEECKTLKNYIKLAPTNIVARDFEGLTLHSFFGIDIKYNYDKHKVLAQARKYRYIIIDEISLLSSKMLQILYYIKLNTKSEFILLGDYDQLEPIEEKNYDYRNSLILKEIVEGNIQVLTENHRFGLEMLDVLNRIDTITETEFEQKLCRVNICATNNVRKIVNEYWMDLDVKLKKKKPLVIEAKSSDLNSQRVKLIPGTPVIAMKGNKTLAVIKGATFKVTKLNPLTVKDLKTKKVTVINPELFQDYFYVNFCTTSHKFQGQTIKEAFTVHEFQRMRKKMKYVALSRATSKNLINVCRTVYKAEKELPDTDFEKIKKKEETALESKRKAAIGVIHRIINGKATEEYCMKHTGLNREALLCHLGLGEDGIEFKGYELDHIKPRKMFNTDEEFEKINWYDNLRLLPRSSNNERNWLEK
jgi:hypothetical protein